MVPDIAPKGHSFKGAFAYYLHDKRQEATGPHLSTAERVAWTETRNLATDDPQTAKRIMVVTALQADELKRSAGIKATGRKSNAHVYAYSLAWHPDEAGKLDRAEMLRAADASLKVLGAEHLQAVIVCHRDQKHPHVHVIVNRVDPATGKMHGFSNDRLQLSDWANAYERERGQILTPKREEKRKNREQIHEQFLRVASPAPEKAVQPARAKSEASMLKELSDAQKARHKAEWIELGAKAKAQRDQVYTEFGRAITETADAQKAKTRPAWAEFFKAARQSEQAFSRREKSITGILQNALAATPLGVRGSLSALFANVLSASSREAAFKAAQERSRGEFSRTVKSRLDAEIKALKDQRAQALSAQRQSAGVDRAALIDRQNAEKAKMRDAWKQVYERRGKDPAYLKSKARDDAKARQATRGEQVQARRTAQEIQRQEPKQARRFVTPTPTPYSLRRNADPVTPAQQNAAPAPEQKPMRNEFDKARELAPAKPPASPAHDRVKISTPAPAPAPAGVPTPPHKTVQIVPQVDRPRDWAKTVEGLRALSKDRAVPPIRKEFVDIVAPAKTPTPAASAPEQKPESRADYWNQRAKDKAADRAQDVPRDRSKDRDFDRDR